MDYELGLVALEKTVEEEWHLGNVLCQRAHGMREEPRFAI